MLLPHQSSQKTRQQFHAGMTSAVTTKLGQALHEYGLAGSWSVRSAGHQHSKDLNDKLFGENIWFYKQLRMIFQSVAPSIELSS